MKAQNLPAPFQEAMEALLGDEYEAYCDSLDEKPCHGLRINRRKLDVQIWERISPFPLEPIPWSDGGYHYEEDLRPSRDPYYYAGLYYLQEPSAQAAAALLPVEPGDRVLDLCAAPGGKSVQLGGRLEGQGLLVSNDISAGRAGALLKNLELSGVPNFCVTCEAPEKLAQVFGGFFDRILVDAPCSGEGMFRRDPDMVKSWLKKGPGYYAAVQLPIVRAAVSMLKPGGLLLYSTCTFSPLEDEGTVRAILDECPDLEPVNCLPVPPGFSCSRDLPGCLRLYPHRLRGEGHFLALLHRKPDPGEDVLQRRVHTLSGERPLPPELIEFLNGTNFPADPDRLFIKNDMVYLLPEGWDPAWRLRCLRTGLLLGQLKKGRFEPAQAFAMALRIDQFSNSFSLSRQDERVIRYLKGETLTLRAEEKERKGWCLVCVDGFPLGFAKGAGRTLKNKYSPGWRWM